MNNTYKLILLLILIPLFLCGCVQKTYTPVLETEFDLNAVYKTGDFSYSCRIKRTKEYVSITPTSTNAKGMTIKFDGSRVYFLKDGMKKEFARDEIDSTNPAVVLYEVFSSIERVPPPEVKIKNSAFNYVGTTSVGTFTLVQSKAEKLKSITIPDAQIEIVFET